MSVRFYPRTLNWKPLAAQFRRPITRTPGAASAAGGGAAGGGSDAELGPETAACEADEPAPAVLEEDPAPAAAEPPGLHERRGEGGCRGGKGAKLEGERGGAEQERLESGGWPHAGRRAA